MASSATPLLYLGPVAQILGSVACPVSHLFVFLHGSVELLGQVVGHVGHTGFLLVGPADTAFILVGFLVVLFLGILAVTLAALQQHRLVRQAQPPPQGPVSSRDSQLQALDCGCAQHRTRVNGTQEIK